MASKWLRVSSSRPQACTIARSPPSYSSFSGAPPGCRPKLLVAPKPPLFTFSGSAPPSAKPSQPPRRNTVTRMLFEPAACAVPAKSGSSNTMPPSRLPAIEAIAALQPTMNCLRVIVIELRS
jgi:hypothetical protein